MSTKSEESTKDFSQSDHSESHDDSTSGEHEFSPNTSSGVTALTQGEPQILLMRHMIQGEQQAQEDHFLMSESGPKITLLI